jgi:hypothetical protein
MVLSAVFALPEGAVPAMTCCSKRRTFFAWVALGASAISTAGSMVAILQLEAIARGVYSPVEDDAKTPVEAESQCDRLGKIALSFGRIGLIAAFSADRLSVSSPDRISS